MREGTARLRGEGALFPRERRKSRSPDMLGKLVISPLLVKHLCNQIEVGEDAELQVAAWHNTSSSGERYLTLVAQRPWESKH